LDRGGKDEQDNILDTETWNDALHETHSDRVRFGQHHHHDHGDNKHGNGKHKRDEQPSSQDPFLTLDLFLESVPARLSVIGGQCNIEPSILDRCYDITDSNHGWVMNDHTRLGEQIDLNLMDTGKVAKCGYWDE
jgi:hypothetical protein